MGSHSRSESRRSDKRTAKVIQKRPRSRFASILAFLFGSGNENHGSATTAVEQLQGGSATSPIVLDDDDDDDDDTIDLIIVDEDEVIDLTLDEGDDVVDFITGSENRTSDPWTRAHYGPRTLHSVLKATLEELSYYKFDHDAHTKPKKCQIYLENKALFQRKFDNIVYTDGSHNFKKKRSGFGVFWGVDHPKNASGPIPHKQSSFNAELYAVYRALLAAGNSHASLRIEIDCVQVIQVLVRFVAGQVELEHFELCGKIGRLLCDYPGPVSLGYVPGHQNIFGNEEADRLARLAANIV